MARFIKNRTDAHGKAPGSLIFLGRKKMDVSIVDVISYNKENVIESNLSSIEEVSNYMQAQNVNWINICGIHDEKLIEKLGEQFKLHPLLLEDMMNTDQRPTYIDDDEYDAFIMKMLRYDGKKNLIQSEQISLVLGSNYVLTLQEEPGDVFDPVRERIRQMKGRVRLNENDYLAYALLDTIADNYIVVVEALGRQIEELEHSVFNPRNENLSATFYRFKTELSYLRKCIRPVREFLLHVVKSENTYFQEKNNKFLTDLLDLITQSTDAIELYNTLLSDLLNIHNTTLSNRMNEVMKVLTIFATLFIPLTFFAGIYGMNFRYMPELDFKYSYPIFWGVSIVLAGLLIWFFRRKRWL